MTQPRNEYPFTFTLNGPWTQISGFGYRNAYLRNLDKAQLINIMYRLGMTSEYARRMYPSFNPRYEQLARRASKAVGLDPDTYNISPIQLESIFSWVNTSNEDLVEDIVNFVEMGV